MATHLTPITASAVAAGSLDHIVIATRREYIAFPPGATFEEVETNLMRRGYCIKPMQRIGVEWAIDKANGKEPVLDMVSPQVCLFDWANSDALEIEE